MSIMIVSYFGNLIMTTISIIVISALFWDILNEFCTLIYESQISKWHSKKCIYFSAKIKCHKQYCNILYMYYDDQTRHAVSRRGCMGVGVPPPAYSCNNFSLVNPPPPPASLRIKILNICRMFFYALVKISAIFPPPLKTALRTCTCLSNSDRISDPNLNK